jgi:hypothetical protein
LFEEFDEFGGAEEVRVFGCDLDDDLEVLTDVGREHFLETDETLVDAQAAKERDEPFGVQVFGADDDTFDILDILIMFQ